MLYSRWSRYMQWSQFIASQQRERQTTVRRPQFNFQMTESCQIEPRRHCGGRWSPWGRATQTQNWSQEAEHHFPAVRQRRQPKKDLDFQAKFKGFGLSEEVLRNAKKFLNCICTFFFLFLQSYLGFSYEEAVALQIETSDSVSETLTGPPFLRSPVFLLFFF